MTLLYAQALTKSGFRVKGLHHPRYTQPLVPLPVAIPTVAPEPPPSNPIYDWGLNHRLKRTQELGSLERVLEGVQRMV